MSYIITNKYGTPYNSYYYSSIYERKYFRNDCFSIFSSEDEAQKCLKSIFDEIQKDLTNQNYQNKISQEAIKKVIKIFSNCKLKQI